MTKPLAVVAVGGNALILDDRHMALADQYDAVCATADHVAAMIAAGWNVVLTHGNGPQVGFILRRSEIADGQVPTVPVQYAVGDTQGAIGFMFQNALGNALQRRGLQVPTVTLVTQTLVDRRDPAFARPDKPIGSFMSEAVARRLASELGSTLDADYGFSFSTLTPKVVIFFPLDNLPDWARAIAWVFDLLARLHEACGLPTRLAQAGVNEDALPKIADLAQNDGSLTYNPAETTRDELLGLLRQAF